LPNSTSYLPRLFGPWSRAAAAPFADRTAAKPQIDRKERVRQAVRRHLRTPTLEPKTSCQLVGMFRSSLYRLLENECGVARYIQRQLLLESQTVLSNPTTT